MSAIPGQLNGATASIQSAHPQFVRRAHPQSPRLNLPNPNTHVSSRQRIETRRQGYPRYAAFVHSDRDFVMFRSFGELHVRILSAKQDEIVELEQKLQQIDGDDLDAFVHSSRRADNNQDRIAVMKSIEEKLLAYNTLLDMYFNHVERPKPERAHVRSVSNWLEGNKPFVKSESGFLANWEDLTAPQKSADKGALDSLVENGIIRLQKSGIAKRCFDVTQDGKVFLLTQDLVASISRTICMILAVLTLIAPIVLLYCVDSILSRIWITALSTTLFSSTLCWLTPSRSYEIFSATAAFCAVMVVFIGSIPNRSSN